MKEVLKPNHRERERETLWFPCLKDSKRTNITRGDIISWIYSVSECLQENCIKDLFCTETCFCLLFSQEGTFSKKILSHRSIKTTKTVYYILLELDAWEKDIKTLEKFMNIIPFVLLDIWRHFKMKSWPKTQSCILVKFCKGLFFSQHTKI